MSFMETSSNQTVGFSRLALLVRYVGSGYEGWQTQPHGRTIQDTLQAAIARIAGELVPVVCAGRTDAGVHARGQVVHCDPPAPRPMAAWVQGVNRFLPNTIAVSHARLVPNSFHARFSAVARSYRYYFYQSPVADPFKMHMTCIHRPLNLADMQEACQYLLGTHDFSSFRAAQCQARSPVRTISHIAIVQEEDCCRLDITADAFLHHMVRNIVGVLFEIGLGRAPVGWAADVLAARCRTQAAKTAPPQGLCLWAVDYGKASVLLL